MSKQVTTKVERGLYERGGKQGSKAHRYVAGYKDPQTGKWTMVTLKARTRMGRRFASTPTAPSPSPANPGESAPASASQNEPSALRAYSDRQGPAL